MTEIREGYKETEIGVIPEDWEVTLVENICDISTGSKNTQDKIDDGEYPFFVRSQNIERINSYSYDGEAILTAGDGVGTGKVYHYINGKFDIHQRVYMMTRFKENYSGKFFYYYFANSFYSRVRRMSAKNSVDSVRRAMIAEMKIPIPPLKEQEKIAEILSTTDKHIEDLDRLIEDYELLKKGMMQKLLTEGIGHTEFKDTEIGRIPKEWDLKSLGELGNTFNGLSGVTKIDFGSGKPYIPYKNIFSNTRVNMNSMDYVKVSGKKKQNKVKYGDVFFTTSSETPEEAGMSSVLLDDVEELYLNSFCFGFRLNDFTTLRPEFARYMLRSKHARKEISKLAQGSTRFNLSKNNVMKVQIPIPTILEQYKISEILDEFEITINQLKDSKDSYTNLKQALMDRLLTGKIRVV